MQHLDARAVGTYPKNPILTPTLKTHFKLSLILIARFISGEMSHYHCVYRTVNQQIGKLLLNICLMWTVSSSANSNGLKLTKKL